MIWLVRHGESVLNAQGTRHGREADAPLTILGAAQAWAAARSLGCLSRDPLMLASPLRRADDTARIMCIALKRSPEIVLLRAALTERQFRDGWLDTCEQVAQRATTALSRWGGCDVIAVTHAGVIKGLLGLDHTPANGSIHAWEPK
jgi:broad specificity phosphatase PhoE